MNATPAWLSLSRTARSTFVDTVLTPIFKKYASVRVRFYDVEAFSAACSDILMFETADLQAYTFVIDALRDSKVFTVPYFDVVGIYPAVEEGFNDYDAHLADQEP